VTSLTGHSKDVVHGLDLPFLSSVVTSVDLESALIAGPDEDVAHFELLNRVARNQPLAVFTVNQKLNPTFFVVPRDAFCVPPNPTIDSLRSQVELSLAKIRTGRNIAGLERRLTAFDTSAQAQELASLGGRTETIEPETITTPPGGFRYRTLIERAKHLVGLAQQLEATFLSILEKRDAEYYNLLKARQDLNLSLAGVRLQQLGMVEARDSVRLTQLQFERAQLQTDYYSDLLGESPSTLEKLAMVGLGVAGTVAGIVTKQPGMVIEGVTALAGMLTGSADKKRREELQQALKMARQEEEIGAQGIRLAQDRLRIRAQELTIASLQNTHAQETLEFLINKFTNAELYDWMSVVIEGVYRSFLQQATAVAQLAANQLAFERQEPIPKFIQADYWEALVGQQGALTQEEEPDRRGLTGSARLLQDIFQLDQYGFDTEQRKQELTKTFSLARMAPAEFQRFRETGVLNFVTLQSMFDEDFPGHFLRLIKRVRVSVVALIPPTEGIKATLLTSGISQVVTRNGSFVETVIRRQPENVSFTTPLNATGEFELSLRQENDLLRPFEGSGVATDWTFELPKSANRFEYRTIADALLTIDYTALASSEYRSEVIERLGTEVSAQRAFTFRHELADQWFDLNNPDQTPTPMTVRFTTRRQDFQPNVTGLNISNVTLLFSLADGQSFEVEVTALLFTPLGDTTAVGGGATSVDAMISTRLGNAATWVPMIGRPPVGEWQLSLPDTEELRAHFQEGRIQDLLLGITYSATGPGWVA
jgi:hypothetical protein